MVAESYLAADFSKSTATFSNSALSVNVTSGRKYRFSVALFLSAALAADGAKINFGGGTAAATNFIVSCVLNNAVGVTLTQANATAAALLTTINVTALTDTNVHVWNCSGGFEPSGTGTFIIQGAKDVNTGGVLLFKRGSWLSLSDAP